jgi:hypothetical protein
MIFKTHKEWCEFSPCSVRSKEVCEICCLSWKVAKQEDKRDREDCENKKAKIKFIVSNQI